MLKSKKRRDSMRLSVAKFKRLRSRDRGQSMRKNYAKREGKARKMSSETRFLGQVVFMGLVSNLLAFNNLEKTT